MYLINVLVVIFDDFPTLHLCMCAPECEYIFEFISRQMHVTQPPSLLYHSPRKCQWVLVATVTWLLSRCCHADVVVHCCCIKYITIMMCVLDPRSWTCFICRKILLRVIKENKLIVQI